MLDPRSCITRRAFFWSDTSDGWEQVAGIEANEAELGVESKSSSAVVHTNPRTEDCQKVGLGWLVCL